MEFDNIFDNNELKFTTNKVTIATRQRNNRQSYTTVTGLENDLDLEKITRYLKKRLNCTGTIVTDKQFGEIITLFGDHRNFIYDFLIEQEICCADDVVIKG